MRVLTTYLVLTILARAVDFGARVRVSSFDKLLTGALWGFVGGPDAQIRHMSSIEVAVPLPIFPFLCFLFSTLFAPFPSSIVGVEAIQMRRSDDFDMAAKRVCLR